MRKNLIVCPSCRNNGTINVLGEIKDGSFLIQRFHKGYTRIIGKDFAVYCEICSEPIYIKTERKDESLNHGFFGISRYSITRTIVPGTA